MSRFKNEVAHLQAHVKTLRLAGAALFVVALLLGFGWWSAPKSLTIHVPPDLRSGSTRKWWDVPPESVLRLHLLAFAGPALADQWRAGLPAQPACTVCVLHAELPCLPAAGLRIPAQQRRATPDMRGIYEIPGRGYGDDPAARVRAVSANDWIVTLDVSADEYLGAEQVKARSCATR